MSIELKSVSYTYVLGTACSAHAIDNMTLKIDKGEFVGIMGKTGCGKSTLLQLIDGLLVPTDGMVCFDGQDIHSKKFDRSILRRKIGVVFQFPEYQLFETTVERDVAFALKHSGLSKHEIRERVCTALGQVGFSYDSIKDKSPLSFSGGEKRRLAIAGVLAARPEYLLLDEPVAGLDPAGRTEFLQLLQALNKGGTAIIMVSHNADALAEYASRILIMEHGSILCDGKTFEIFSDYDMLREKDISTGQVSSIVHLLRQRGIDIPCSTVKYNQLVDELCRIYGGNVL